MDGSGPRKDGAVARERFAPHGGELGAMVGLSAIVAARIAVEGLGPIAERSGADVGAASQAMIVLILLGLAVGLAMPVVLRGRMSRRFAVARVVGTAAVILAARVTTHEVALRAALPDAGGVSPIVDVRGRLLDTPRREAVRSGATPTRVGENDSISWRATLVVESVGKPDHPSRAVHAGLIGRHLAVAWPREDARLAAGGEVALRGRLVTVPPPANPGEPDRRRGARRGVPARLVVPSSALIESTAEAETDFGSMIASLRAGWGAAAIAVDEAVTRTHPKAEGLVAAVLAGDRRRLPTSTRHAAEDAGLAPLLAISGWHLALVAVFAAAIAGRHRPLGRVVALVIVTLFALAVVPGPSVRRAATMAVVGGGFVIAGRRPRGLPLVAVAAMLVVWCDPSITDSTGFALSVLATVALVIGAGPARRRWFGPADRVGRRRRSIGRDPATAVATASIVAWVVSTPVLLATFGRWSLVAVPAMIVVAPIFVVLLGSALATTLWVAAIGAAPASLTVVTGMVIEAFVTVTEGIAAVAPIGRIVLPSWSVPPAIASAICLAIAFGRASRSARWGWRAAAASIFGTVLLIGWWNDSRPAPGTLRVDLIAVGDGTAMLVRGPVGTALIDAGSSSIEDVGRRVVVPALRALGVRRLDAIVVTHANLDHFNAVADVVRGLPTDQVAVAPPLFVAARREPTTGVGDWLHGLHAAGVPVIEATRGDRLRCGDLDLRVLHPRAGERCRSANDASIVATIGLVDDAVERPRLLVCGDIQDEAIARILAREPALSASVMELPHHGSWRPIAAALLSRVDPAAIVQSTGPERWWSDRWRDVCGGRRRGITCRDGMISVEVDAGGVVRWSGGRRSEEPQARLVSAVLRPAVGAAPDDHDRAVEPLSLGQHRDEDTGHSLQQRRAGGDPHAGLAEVE